MTQHDELLARLDGLAIRLELENLISAPNSVKDAATAIRDLSAKLEAERALRNPQEWLELIGELRENAVAIRGGHGGEQFDADLMDRAALQLEVALSANEAERKAREEAEQLALKYCQYEEEADARTLAAESRLAQVFERTRERAAKVCAEWENNGCVDMDHPYCDSAVDIALRDAEQKIRALDPEKTTDRYEIPRFLRSHND